MQNSQLFRSFLKKKQSIFSMMTQSKSPKNTDHFKHFQAISQPTLIKAQSNAMYLSHLNNQFKDQLRQFVHEQQSFKVTMDQLNKISYTIENQLEGKQKQYQILKTQMHQNDLEKEVYNTKGNALLNKIITYQEQIKLSKIQAEQFQKIATNLQEQIQFQSQVVSQIKVKNHELIQKLQLKAVEIQNLTTQMEDKEKSIRNKQSQFKKINSDIKSLYFTLESQDVTLTQLCDQIQTNLNKQSLYINDIQEVKNNLSTVLTQSQKAKNQLNSQQKLHARLLNSYDDLCFEARRVNKQLQIQNKGIDQQYWKIQQQKRRIQQNRQMLLQLQQYLQELIYKNQMLQSSLEEQIIQDHSIKKIVDSKCNQPVGMKTKKFLSQIQQKQMRSLNSTNSSFKDNFKENSKLSQVNYQQKTLNKTMTKSRSSLHYPQQMQFVFQKFSNLKQTASNQFDQCHQVQNQQFSPSSSRVSKMMNTGFSYINTLTRLQVDNRIQ